MLVLSMDGLDDFLEVTNFVHSRNKYYNTVDFKCSQAMLSMTVSRRSPRCVIELQTMPQFFTLFFCDQISHSTISIHEFFTTLFDMKRSGFYLMIFSLTEPLGHLHLTFITYSGQCYVLAFLLVSCFFPFHPFSSLSGDDRCEAYVPLLLPFEEADPALINYGTFVSILSQEFLRIAVILNLPYGTHILTNSVLLVLFQRKCFLVSETCYRFLLVFVTLTNSQVKFDVGTREGFTLTEEVLFFFF